jgi:trimethylamine:corrinoid methyltransferase-like protein
VRIPPHRVAYAIRSAPSVITYGAREPERDSVWVPGAVESRPLAFRRDTP